MRFSIILTALLGICVASYASEINLAGNWTVKLDPMNVGINEAWAQESIEGQTILLPGTLDDAELGTANTLTPEMSDHILRKLTRKHQYIGVAWYQKEVEIPSNWEGKKQELELERIIWESQVYVDGKLIGKNESLVAPHRYNLSEDLTPGTHTITVRIDNSNRHPLISVNEMAHAYTDHTQIRWNGIIGDLILRAYEPNRLANLQIYSNVAQSTIKASFKRNSSTQGALSFKILSTAGDIISEGIIEAGAEQVLLPKPDGLALWDEFNPSLYDFKIFADSEIASARFGFSQIEQKDAVLTLNGHRIFLRGNLECVIFPLSGHPPMEKQEWATLIAQAKAYGLNHLRFHSWCPPKAAFEAADEAGFYYQVELPHWSLRFGEDQTATQFLLDEGDKILREYGNHPSFILMSLGNEIQGDVNLLNTTVAALRAKDKRHLYTTTTYSFQYPLGTIAQPEDDFFVTQRTDKGWVRGQGIFNDKAPNFSEDYTASSAHVSVPLLSHEIGQYSVYPDMREIEKYTGVLTPLNFMAIRNDLERKDLLNLANNFTYASGKFAALLYKEEIERALKTPSFDGFQLLQLQDFPGQGTALVGLLNAFWESKGVISAKEFRTFNAELVPLIRFEKAIYETGERFNASIEIANFYKELKDQTLNWSITNEAGEKIHEGTQSNIDLHLGNNTNLGSIEFEVSADKAEKLRVNVALIGTEYENNWPIWVYPKNASTDSEKVLVTKSLKTATKALREGKTVLLNPDYNNISGITGRFVPVFWSPVHFPNQPGTMGLLMDENHAAFNDFPTSGYTEWQWWDLCIKSVSVNIDSLNVSPIVRVIDNFISNRRLANVFETKVGDGKLVFSSIDLMNKLDDRPAARQLRASLIQYMESADFNPSTSTAMSDFDFVNDSYLSQDTWELMKVDSEDLYASGNPAINAFDGNRYTFWHTEWFSNKPVQPHEIVIDLRDTAKIYGFNYLPRQDGNTNGNIKDYQFFAGNDTSNWANSIASGTFASGTTSSSVIFTDTIECRYIRLVALSEINGKEYANIAELNLMGYYKSEDANLELGIKPTFELETIKIFPNPFSNTINLRFSNNKSAMHWRMFSLDGKLLKEGNIPVDGNYLNINAVNFKPGIYIFELGGETGKLEKLLIKH